MERWELWRRRVMKRIQEPARELPVIAETDVLVVGGGPGGLSAALSAARAGVETMLLERHGCLGGVITQAMVGTLAWYRTNEKVVDAGGIGVEFEQRAKQMEASLPIFLYQVLDTEKFKFIADQMIQEAGIVPLLHCPTVDVIMEGNTVKGVITESKAGRQAILP
jgi:ribulose 1,5-bisphosphate synthetase/thiazole synthase